MVIRHRRLTASLLDALGGVCVADEKQPLDRALELFVYAPVGVALYVRDMLPSMMGIFVSRGRREVRSHLGLQDSPPPPPPPIADLRRRVGESVGMARGVAEGGIGLARDVTGSALQGLLSRRDGMPAQDRAGDDTIGAEAPLADRPPAARPEEPGAAAVSSSDEPVPSVEALPIPDYDELSASQVIERLAGLDPESLDAIRAYEAKHRGRNTILGKIAQLT
jgi:hypothetical protein